MSTHLTTVLVEFVAKDGQADALTKALSDAIKFTVSKPNCFEAKLHVDHDDPNRLVIYERWKDAASHKAYADEAMSNPDMAPVMEMLAEPPQMTYLAVEAAGGGFWGGPGHIELCSTDVPATKEFLGEVFDWRFDEAMPGYDMFTAPGPYFGGLRPMMEHESDPYAIPYLVVDDLDDRLERVKAAGGKITVPIQEVPHAGRFFWFMTPGGLQLAAWESATHE